MSQIIVPQRELLWLASLFKPVMVYSLRRKFAFDVKFPFVEGYLTVIGISFRQNHPMRINIALYLEIFRYYWYHCHLYTKVKFFIIYTTLQIICFIVF